MILDDVVAHAKALRDTEQQLRKAVAQAHAVGEPVTEIAKAAGVRRQTVYRWVEQYKNLGEHGRSSVHVQRAINDALAVMVVVAGLANQRTLLDRINTDDMKAKILGIRIGTASMGAKPGSLKEVAAADLATVETGKQAAIAAERAWKNTGHWPEYVQIPV